MSKEERKVPELRFKDFHDDWEQRKLKMVFKNFIVPMRDKPKIFSGDIPWTRIEDIQGRYLHGSTSGRYVSEDTVKSMNLKVIPKDSIIVSVSATFGVVAIVSNDLITNQTFIGLTPKPNYNIDFLYSFFKSSITRKKMRNESAGSTIFYITRKNIENMIGNFPSNEEQDKIGKFLKSLDTIIALHQRKINILKTLKKVYLNVMFSNRSEDIPRLHFKSFSEAWEQCEVSNLSQKTFGGGTPKTSKKIYWDGDIPWIQSSDLKEHNVKSIRVNKKITKIGLEHSAAKLIPKNSLAIVTRVGVGKVALIPFEYTTSQDFLSLSNLNVDKYFGLYLMYHNLQKELLALQGTSIKGITKKEVLKKRVRVPKDLQEQVSIGKSLKELDSYINLHQRKLHKLNKIKQVYLNKMFI